MSKKIVIAFIVLSIFVLAGCQNSIPVITNLTASKIIVSPNETVLVTCNVDKGNQDFLKYSWFSSKGEFLGMGHQVEWIAPVTTGSEKIIVSVTAGTTIVTKNIEIKVVEPVSVISDELSSKENLSNSVIMAQLLSVNGLVVLLDGQVTDGPGDSNAVTVTINGLPVKVASFLAMYDSIEEQSGIGIFVESTFCVDDVIEVSYIPTGKMDVSFVDGTFLPAFQNQSVENVIPHVEIISNNTKKLGLAFDKKIFYYETVTSSLEADSIPSQLFLGGVNQFEIPIIGDVVAGDYITFLVSESIDVTYTVTFDGIKWVIEQQL